MNRDVSLFELFKDLFGSVPTVNGKPPPKSGSTHEGSSSKKKKKSSDASVPAKEKIVLARSTTLYLTLSLSTLISLSLYHVVLLVARIMMMI